MGARQSFGEVREIDRNRGSISYRICINVTVDTDKAGNS